MRNFCLILLLSLFIFISSPQSVFASGIGLNNFSGDVTIVNTDLRNNFNGIVITTTNVASTGNRTLDNLWIYSNKIQDSRWNGVKIGLSGSGAITIENNFLDNADTPDTGANSVNGRSGIRILSTFDPSIANNTVQNFGRSGIELKNAAGITVVNNYLYSNGSQNYKFGADHHASGLQALDSTFVNVSNNFIVSNRFAGISVDSTGGTIDNNNIIKYNGDPSLPFDDGAAIEAGACLAAAGSVEGGILVRNLNTDETLEVCGNSIYSNRNKDIGYKGGGTLTNCGVPKSQKSFFATSDDAVIYLENQAGVDLDCANPGPYAPSMTNQVIDAAGFKFGILITGSVTNATVRNCTIKNAAMDYANRAAAKDGATTRYLGAGIFIGNNASPMIHSNYIFSNGWGILDDQLYTNAGASGIQMRCADANTSIYNNLLVSNANDGLVARETSGYIGLNTFRNNQRGGIGIYKGTVGNLAILDNAIYTNKRGIGVFDFDGDLKISNNYIYSNKGGLSSAGGIGFVNLSSVANVTIENNIIASNSGWKVGGIGLTNNNAAISVVNFNVFSNTISNNKQSGIGIRWAQAFTIRNNIIFSNSGHASDPANDEYYSFGIQLRDSHISSNGVVDNIIHSNKNAGIGAYNCTGTIGPNNEIKYNGNPDAAPLSLDCFDVGLGGKGGISAKGLITDNLYAEGNILQSTNYHKDAQHGSGSIYDFIVDGQVINPSFMDKDSAAVFVNSRGKVFVNGAYYSDSPIIDGVADPANFANISDGSKVWGIAVAGGATGVTIRNCNVFQNNTIANTLGPGGTNLGGGIFVGPSAQAMIFSNNVYNNSDPGAAIPPKGEGGTAGIVLRCSSSAVTLRNNSITDNRGDGISVKDSSVVIGEVNAANSIINNGRMGIAMTGGGDPRFGYNYVFSNGNGGIGLYSITSSVQVYSNYIYSNIGKDNPGGVGVIYMDGATADIRNNVILQNSSERVNNVPWGIGVAESTSGNVIIENNVVASNGREQGSTLVGGIGIQGVSASLPATLDNLTISSNRISNHGKKRAAIAFKWYKGPINIRNNRKDGLGLYANGEGIRFQELAEGATVNISNNLFLDNNNIFSNGGSGLEFKDCSFVNVEIDNNLMSHNTWNTGDSPSKSVISFEYSQQYSNNFIKIRRNTIKNSNNKGIVFKNIDGVGGVDTAYVSIFSNEIYSNVGGMGIFDLSNAQVNVEGNSIYANQSSSMGGLGLSTTNGTFSFMNNAIFGNKHLGNGPGGIGFYELNTLISIRMEGNSIYNNDGWRVGGIGITNTNAADLSTVTLYSNAIFRNRQSGIAVWNGSFVNIQNNKISSNGWAGEEDPVNVEFYGSGIMARNGSFANANITGNTVTSNWFSGIALFSTIGSVGDNNTIMYNGVTGGGSSGGSMENCVAAGGSAGNIRGGVLAKGLGGADEITIGCTNTIIGNYDNEYAKWGGGTLRSCSNVAASFFASNNDAAFYFDDSSGTLANLDCAAPTAEQLAIYNIQNSTINAENKKFGIIVIGNGANTTIQNCTIKNAAMNEANRVTVTNQGETRYFGSGIFIANNASPIIHGNYIFSNGWGVIQDNDPIQAGASGIQMRCADANTSIYNNVIASNQNDGIVVRESGGLIGLSNQGNTFRNNGRGGVDIKDSTIRNLEIAYNTINNNKRGIGVVDFDGTMFTIANNYIYSNKGNNTYKGGGIRFNNLIGSVKVDSNLIDNNIDTVVGGIGFTLGNANISIVNNTIRNNAGTISIGEGSGGIGFSGGANDIILDNNKIYSNTGAAGIGIVGGNQLTIINNNTIRNNSGVGIGFGTASPAFTGYALIDGNTIQNNDGDQTGQFGAGGIGGFGITGAISIANNYIYHHIGGTNNEKSGIGFSLSNFSSPLNIVNNTMVSNDAGSIGFDSSVGDITVYSNTLLDGVAFRNNTGGDINISVNNITGDGVRTAPMSMVYATVLANDNDRVSIINNIIDGNQQGYNGIMGVCKDAQSGFEISGNTLRNALKNGMSLGFVHDDVNDGKVSGSIHDNYLQGNRWRGILLFNAMGISVYNNTIYNNGEGNWTRSAGCGCHGPHNPNEPDSNAPDTGIAVSKWNRTNLLSAHIYSNLIYSNNACGINLSKRSVNDYNPSSSFSIFNNTIGSSQGGNAYFGIGVSGYPEGVTFNLDVFDNKIINNDDTGIGMNTFSGTARIQNNYIRNNQSSPWELSGGIGLTGGSPTISIMNNTIFSNKSTASGPGGIGFNSLTTSSNARIYGNSISNNSGWIAGGIGITDSGGAYYIGADNTIFSNDRSGIAINNTGSVEIYSSTITNGLTIKDTGSVEIYSSTITNGLAAKNCTTLNVRNNTITGIALDGDAFAQGTLTLQALTTVSIFSNYIDGSGIAMNQVEDSSIASNSTIQGQAFGFGVGGTIVMRDITHSTIRNNGTIGNDGIANYGFISQPGRTFVVENNTLIKGRSYESANGSWASINVNNVDYLVVNGNDTIESGIAFKNVDTAATISNNQMIGDAAIARVTGSSPYSYGVILANAEDSAALDSLTITNNPDIRVTDSLISSANGISVNGSLSNVDVLIQNNTITGIMDADGAGHAGIRIDGSLGSSIATVSQNTVKYMGHSGIAARSFTNLVVNDNTVGSCGLANYDDGANFYASGIQLMDSHIVTNGLGGNTIYSNRFAGISLSGTDGTVGPNNVIENNGIFSPNYQGGGGSMEECEVAVANAGDIRGGVLVRKLAGGEEVFVDCTNVVRNNWHDNIAKIGGGMLNSCGNVVSSFFATSNDTVFYFDASSGHVELNCAVDGNNDPYYPHNGLVVNSVINAATAKGSPTPFGIIIVGDASDVTVTNCTVKNAAMNEAARVTVTNAGETRYIGAGMFIVNNAAPSISNNYIFSNGWGVIQDNDPTQAGASGIQMRCGDQEAKIVNNTFAKNKNDGIVIRESGGIIGAANQGNTFINNGRGGIGIYDGSLRNLTINENVIYNNQRGIGVFDFDGTFLNITNNKIYSNVGNLSSPGAIGFKNLAAASTNTAVTIQNNILSSNSGWKVGGIGLTSENPAATVVNFNIFSNTISNHQQSGIGVEWAEGFFIRNNVIFSNGLQDSGSSDEHYAFGIQVRNSSFYNNSVQANSIRNNKFAGIGAYTTSGSIGPNNTIEYNGDASGGGLCQGIGGSGRGGISARDLAQPLYGSGNTFNANIPKDAQNNPNSLAPFYNEGALVKNTYWTDTDVAANGKITKSTLINNATFTGGNVWGMTVIGPYDVTIQNSTIKNNCADSQICSIQGETGQTVGGGILIAGGAKVYLDNNLIASNGANAKTAGNGGYAGVAVRCADSETYLVNNTIRNNKNDGIVTYDTDGYIGLYGQGNIVYDNARNGIGLNSFAGGDPKSGPKIAYNSIYSNQAFGVASWGLTNMNATLQNNTIKDNHLGPDNTLGPGGTDMGGGVGLISFKSQAFIDDNTIKNNRGSSGGGIGVSASNSATFSIKNNLVMDNISSMVGGIGFNDLSVSQVYLEGNRVASNLGDKIGAVGATVVNSGGYFSFVNNKIMNNIGSSWDSAVENVGGIGFNDIADVNTAIYLSQNTLINNKAYDAATVGAVKRVGAVGISLSNATVSIVNNRVGNNQGSCIGGIGFDMYGSGDPTATAVIFSNRIFGNVNNKSSLGAGGLAFDYLDGTVTVLNNRIYNNSNLATGAGGLGLNKVQANASVLIKNNSVYNNDGYRAGGIGITLSNTSDINIYSNTIFYNYQLGLGIWDVSFLNIQNNFIVTNGLIEAYDQTLGENYASGIQLRNSTFNNNNISGNTIRNNPFSGIQVYDSGGTIGPNNVIEYNGKNVGGGGGLCAGIGGSAVRGGIAARDLNSFGDMVVEDPSLLVSNNYTEGAVHKPGSSNDLTFRNAKVESTKLNDTVAVVYVTSNTTINCADPGSPFFGVGIKNGKVWGVAAVGNYDVTIINCDIADNCTNETDCDLVGTEGSRIGGGVLVSGGADVYMTNNNIYNNVYTKQTNEGGMAGVTIRCAGAGTTLFNNNIYNNKNDGIALFDTVSYISQNTIENNNRNGIGVSSFGGGSGGTSVIYNNYINSNTEFGVATSSLQNMTLSIVNNVISSNNASGSGGGVGLNEMFNSAFVVENTIRNNFSGSGTGGIGASQSSGTITITANVVHDNTSTSGPGGIGVTGQLSSGVFVAESNIVRNNSGSAAGGIGGKDSDGTVLVVSNSVYSNTSSTLGGIGVINQLAGQIVVNGNSVRNNDGTTTGGIGFTASNATLSVMNNYLYNNTSGKIGGMGLLNINDGAVQVDGNTIINNDGDLIGGIGVSTVNTSFPFNITFNYVFSHMDAGVEIIAGSFLNIQDNVIATNGWSGVTGGNAGLMIKNSTFTNGNIARNYIRNNEFVGIAAYSTSGYIGPNNYLLYNGNSDGTASGLYGPGEGYGGAGVRNLEITDTLRFSENEIMANKFGEVTRKDCNGTVYNNGVEVTCGGGYWTDADSVTMINQSDVTLDCGGGNITGGTIWGIAVVGPVNNVTINNCNIFGNGTSPNSSGNKGQGVGGGILVAEGANVYISNNNIYNNGVLGSAGLDGYAGIALKGAGSGTTVVNNNIHDNLNDGIVIVDAEGVIGYDVASKNTITANGRNGIGTKSDKGGGNVRIAYNDISNNDQGVALSGNITISLDNNTIFNNTTRGLAIGGGQVGTGGSIAGFSANSVNLASGDNSTAGFYDGWVLQMTSGSASPSHVMITDYTGGASKTATINQNWATTPSNGDSYEIHMAPVVKLNAHDNEIYGSGQGVAISYASPGADIQIYSNDVHDNTNNSIGPAGLGIRDALSGTRVWVRNNKLVNNKWTGGGTEPGGLGIQNSSGWIKVSSNDFRNDGSLSGGAVGIQDSLPEAHILVQNNLFSGFDGTNTATAPADLGVRDIRHGAFVEVDGNTFKNNTTDPSAPTPRYAGIFQSSNYTGQFGYVGLYNNDFSGNPGGGNTKSGTGAIGFGGVSATQFLDLSGPNSVIDITGNTIADTPCAGLRCRYVKGTHASNPMNAWIYIRDNNFQSIADIADCRAVQFDDIGDFTLPDPEYVNMHLKGNIMPRGFSGDRISGADGAFGELWINGNEMFKTGSTGFSKNEIIVWDRNLTFSESAVFPGSTAPKTSFMISGNLFRNWVGDLMWWTESGDLSFQVEYYMDGNTIDDVGRGPGWNHSGPSSIYFRGNSVVNLMNGGTGKLSNPGIGLGMKTFNGDKVHVIGNYGYNLLHSLFGIVDTGMVIARGLVFADNYVYSAVDHCIGVTSGTGGTSGGTSYVVGNTVGNCGQVGLGVEPLGTYYFQDNIVFEDGGNAGNWSSGMGCGSKTAATLYMYHNTVVGLGASPALGAAYSNPTVSAYGNLMVDTAGLQNVDSSGDNLTSTDYGLFDGASGHGYRLASSATAAIDKFATDYGVIVDADNHDRLAGGNYDYGADEYGSSGNHAPVISNLNVAQSTTGDKMVTISYTGTDPDNASGQIYYPYASNQYSLDGTASWFAMENMTIWSTYNNTFSSGGSNFDVKWYVGKDLPNVETNDAYVRITANDWFQDSNTAQYGPFNIDTRAPRGLDHLHQLNPPDGNTIALEWTQAEDPLFLTYEIIYTNGSNQTIDRSCSGCQKIDYTTAAALADTATTTMNVGGLAPTTTYSFNIFAVDSVGNVTAAFDKSTDLSTAEPASGPVLKDKLNVSTMVQVPAGEAQRGFEEGVYAFNMFMGSGTANVTAVNLTWGSSNAATNGGDVQNARLYADTGVLGKFDGESTPIATLTYAGGYYGNSSLSEAIGTTPKYYLVTLDILAGATLGDNLQLALEASDHGTNPGVSFSDDPASVEISPFARKDGNIQIISDVDTLYFTNTLVSGPVTKYKEQGVFAFNLNAGASGPATATVNLMNLTWGTSNAAVYGTGNDVQNARLYKDLGTIGVFEPGTDQFVTSLSYAANYFTAAGLSEVVGTTGSGTDQDYIVTLDILGTAVANNNVRLAMEASSYPGLAVNSPDVVNSFSKTNGTLLQMVDAPHVTVAVAENVPAGADLLPGEGDPDGIPLQRIKFTSTGGAATVTNIILQEVSSASQGDIGWIAFYTDDGDAVFEPGVQDILIGSASPIIGTDKFELDLSPYNWEVNGTKYMLATVRVADGASSGTVIRTRIENGFVDVDSPNTVSVTAFESNDFNIIGVPKIKALPGTAQQADSGIVDVQYEGRDPDFDTVTFVSAGTQYSIANSGSWTTINTYMPNVEYFQIFSDSFTFEWDAKTDAPDVEDNVYVKLQVNDGTNDSNTTISNVFALDTKAPGAPSNLGDSGVTPYSIPLTWTKSSGDSGGNWKQYEIYFKACDSCAIDRNDPGLSLQTAGAGDVNIQNTTLDSTNNGIQPSTTYRMNIWAVDSFENVAPAVSEYQVTTGDILNVGQNGTQPSGSVEQGESNSGVVMQKIQLNAGANTVTVDSLKVQQTGTAAAGDIAWVEFHDDSNNDGVPDSLIGTATESAGEYGTATGLGYVVTAGTTSNVLVLVKTADAANTLNNITMSMQSGNVGVLTPDAAVETAFSGGTFGITGNSLTPFKPSQPAAVELTPSETDRVVMKLGYTASYGYVDIDALTLKQIGTDTGTSIAKVKLYEDDDGDGIIDPEDSLLYSDTSVTAGEYDFTISPAFRVTAGANSYMQVAIDTTGALEDLTTVKFQLENASKVTVSDPDSVLGTSLPIESNEFTTPMGNETLTISAGTALSGGNLNSSTTEVELLTFAAQVTVTGGDGTVTINDITLDQPLGNSADFVAGTLKLYKDDTNPGVFDGTPTDQLLGTFTWMGTYWQLTSTISESVDTLVHNYLVVADLSSTGGDQIQLDLRSGAATPKGVVIDTAAGDVCSNSGYAGATITINGDTVTIGAGTALSDGNENSDAVNVKLLTFTSQVTASGDDSTATITDITLDQPLGSNTDFVAGTLKLYKDDTNPGVFDGTPTDQELGTFTWTGTYWQLTSTISESVGTSVQNYLVVADLSNSNTAGGDQIRLDLRSDAATPEGVVLDTSTADADVNSGHTGATITVNGDTVTISAGSQISNGNALPDATEVRLLRFEAQVTTAGDDSAVTITDITLDQPLGDNLDFVAGTLKLYKDDTNPGVFDGTPTDQELGTFTWTGSYWQLTVAISESVGLSTQNYLVVADLNSTEGDQIKLSLRSEGATPKGVIIDTAAADTTVNTGYSGATINVRIPGIVAGPPLPPCLPDGSEEACNLVTGTPPMPPCLPNGLETACDPVADKPPLPPCLPDGSAEACGG